MVQFTAEDVLAARESEAKREAFLKESENFILTTASRHCKRYISKSDDEWMEALIAYNGAIDAFDVTKGNFNGYAKVVMEHRLTDYFRSQAKYMGEMSTEPEVFSGSVDDEDEGKAALQNEIAKKASVSDENPIRDEIMALTEELADFDIQFLDLVACSPKAEKTRRACREVVSFVVEDRENIDYLMRTKRLPIKKIKEILKIPPKILERYRKYIITAILIAKGDYPGMYEYLNLK